MTTSPQTGLPLSRPRVTYGLLGLIAVAFVVQLVAGGSTSTRALVEVGAQINSLVATGEAWRLLTAMFLHIGLPHLAFNAWALFSVGSEVEAAYGSVRFTLLYVIAGLTGNIAYYLFGPDVLSAGASGAVFGLIGSMVAFFLLNRELFGKFGRERLANLAVLIGINLVFGFTTPGINNLAHLGGLTAGFLLGLALSPRYRVMPVTFPGSPDHPEPVTARALFDRRSRAMGALALLAAAALLFGGLRLGHQRWAGEEGVLRLRAAAAFDAGDYEAAQALLEQAVAADPENGYALYNLGLVYLRQDKVEQGMAVLEAALRALPDEPLVWYALGATYAQHGRGADARPLLERFLAQETSGMRAEAARKLLDSLP